MKAEAAYRLTFQDYPDVVNIEQMCQMLGGISTKTGYIDIANVCWNLGTSMCSSRKRCLAHGQISRPSSDKVQ